MLFATFPVRRLGTIGKFLLSADISLNIIAKFNANCKLRLFFQFKTENKNAQDDCFGEKAILAEGMQNEGLNAK
ncbi:MAG: hypothetical protein A3C22_03060 [Candidatus Levybacteria bacterium RIFCSPHIGHO2_02_FULL_37_10]|nr:MAG: hypothetical protein A3C22_03060 [Candidatus Levybacteria bacterium RIFCSPHIGHO2_02_FULL_37_10]